MRSCAIHVHKHTVEAMLLQQCREVTVVILSITPWLPTYMGQSLIRCNTPKEEFRVMELPYSGKMQARITDPIYPPVTQSISRLNSSHPGNKQLSLSSGLPGVSRSICSDGARPNNSNGKEYCPDQKWNSIPNMHFVPGGLPTYPVYDGNFGSTSQQHR